MTTEKRERIGIVDLHWTEYERGNKTFPVLEIVLNDNGSAGNSVTKKTMRTITDQVRSAGDTIVVITNAFKNVDGAKRTSFCGGLNRSRLICELKETGYCKEMLGCLKDLYLVVASHRFPTVAWVDGNAAGGGVGLALCCDRVLARESIMDEDGYTEPVRFNIPSGGYRYLAEVLIPIIDWAHKRPESGAGPIELTRADLHLFIGTDRSVTDRSKPSWFEVLDGHFQAGDKRANVIPSYLGIWPPVEAECKNIPHDIEDRIDEAIEKANEPEAIREIAATTNKAAAAAIEKCLDERLARAM